MSILVGATSACAGAAGQGPSADLGDTIDQSLRFTGAGRLVSADTKPSGDYTLAFWWKRGDDPQGSNLDALLTFTPNGGYQFCEPQRSNQSGISVRDGATLRDITDGTLPDYSAWYHICIISESGTSRCYVNGVKQSNTGAEPTGGVVMCIGSNQIASQDDALVGYLAEFNLLDGTVVGDTNDILDEFGRYNQDGVWVPKEITFTAAQYGAKGFRLTFDSSADGGIGDDSAPTGTGHSAANDFTATGFDTAAISSSNFDNDIDYNDTPTSNYQTYNRNHPSPVSSMSEANLLFTGDASWDTAFSTIGMTSGKFYWEVTTDGAEALHGICNEDFYYGRSSWTFVGANTGSWGYYTNTGSRYIGGGSQNQTWASRSGSANDIYMFAFDADTGTLWVGANGSWLASATQSEIEAGTTTNSLVTAASGNTFYAADSLATGTKNTRVNYGQRDFIYTKPSGYNAIQTNNLPEPTIKNGKEHFDVITWSGDNVSPRTITGLEFEPDFIWTKRRSAASHLLYDSVRGFGETKHLHSDVTDAEGSANELNTNVAGFVSDNASNGFVLTQGTSNHDATNGTGNTYVAWCWKAGGTAVTNTDGTNSNTVNVSANQDAGFSIVTYTGETSNSPNTIGHGLNAVPEVIIVKRRNATENWAVYHASLGNDRSLELHDTTAQSASTSAFWNSTTPTSSVFSVGNGGATNEAGGTYVAYVWAPKEGFSKFGSYAGNSSSDGPFIYTGFKVGWLMWKASSRTGNWQIYDSTRSPNNPNGQWLEANGNAQEQSGNSTYNLDLLSNGFKLRGNATFMNESGQTYIYMAFAENPFGGENAPPATAR